jgi:hypothetical protein
LAIAIFGFTLTRSFGVTRTLAAFTFKRSFGLATAIFGFTFTTCGLILIVAASAEVRVAGASTIRLASAVESNREAFFIFLVSS